MLMFSYVDAIGPASTHPLDKPQTAHKSSVEKSNFLKAFTRVVVGGPVFLESHQSSFTTVSPLDWLAK